MSRLVGHSTPASVCQRDATLAHMPCHMLCRSSLAVQVRKGGGHASIGTQRVRQSTAFAALPIAAAAAAATATAAAAAAAAAAAVKSPDGGARDGAAVDSQLQKRSGRTATSTSTLTAIRGSQVMATKDSSSSRPATATRQGTPAKRSGRQSPASGATRPDRTATQASAVGAAAVAGVAAAAAKPAVVWNHEVLVPGTKPRVVLVATVVARDAVGARPRLVRTAASDLIIQDFSPEDLRPDTTVQQS